MYKELVRVGVEKCPLALIEPPIVPEGQISCLAWLCTAHSTTFCGHVFKYWILIGLKPLKMTQLSTVTTFYGHVFKYWILIGL